MNDLFVISRTHFYYYYFTSLSLSLSSSSPCRLLFSARTLLLFFHSLAIISVQRIVFVANLSPKGSASFPNIPTFRSREG